MKVTALAIVPPPAAQGCPRLTPELLASSLARYSRSCQGIEKILAAVDWDDPDKSADKIFRFVDYGHASIGGLTGGIPMVVDGCSMFLAYKLFELSPLADGQESSTRYIAMNESSLPDPGALGLPPALTAEWRSVMAEAFGLYNEFYEELDGAAKANPEIVRLPAGAKAKTAARLRKNYALDRCRYLIPFAARTNAALVMTARSWAETLRQLDSLPQREARECARLLRSELEKFTPRLIKHSYPDQASLEQARREWERSLRFIRHREPAVEAVPDEVFVHISQKLPGFLPAGQSMEEAFAGKENRYSRAGNLLRRMQVRFAWNNIAVAELRDLNRHRSGFRFSPLTPAGFYLPPEIDRSKAQPLLERHAKLLRQLSRADEEKGGASYVYGLLLGNQTPFEHSTHADKFIYEAELRTGLGAHFRYAEHLRAACAEFIKQAPEASPFIRAGEAEPE